MWRAMGYRVALWRDYGDDTVESDYLKLGDYPGYAKAANALIGDVLALDAGCNWIVTGGDDTDPDPKKPAFEIARECAEKFDGTFGVMQPTGDRFAGGSIDRIAGSPWIGREFCERAYGGNGPYFEGYRHMFVDEEIMQVALKLGVFWQRPDLTHLHRHFMRESDAIDSRAVARPVPPHLAEANSPGHWKTHKTIFLERKSLGFPGHEASA
jgi:hypothetical protein